MQQKKMFDSECTSTLSVIDEELTATLVDIVRGIEKEGLRVSPDNTVAQTSHRKALGSTLTHPSITTDYSEALLEFITPTQNVVEDSIDYLSNLHRFTQANIDDELIWPASMPCQLNGDQSIPIADYGRSNVGQLKHVYRQGLGVRYGRVMQSIAGIHYNFSLPDAFWRAYQSKLDAEGSSLAEGSSHAEGSTRSLQDFKSEHYFSLIRNFRRYSWILHYLFGASPVLDKSFLGERTEHGLQALTEQTYGLPYATSLRMSDLGYQNSAQKALHVSYNSLDDYVTTLAEAMTQGYEPYEKIGVKVDGQYTQLNTNVLQIENEYYSDIRPKRVTRSGEKPIAALRERGVEYIEVRILDINPFLPEGIDETQIRFLDVFLLYCLLSQCPNQSDTGCPEIRGNQRNVILRGRDPALKVVQNGEAMPFKEGANTLLDAMMDAAQVLDNAHGGDGYRQAVAAHKAKVENPSLTPSGRIMAKVKSGQEFLDIVRQQAEKHKKTFTEQPRNVEFEAELVATATKSLHDQAELEANDRLSFDDYLEAYNRN